MEKTGRIMKDTKWVHEFDWQSLWFSLTGSGYIREGCVPSVSDLNEITVSDGTCVFDRLDDGELAETVFEPEDNGDIPHPRYDCIAIVRYTDLTKEIVLVQGTPAEEPKPPSLDELGIDVINTIPIALIYYRPYSTNISELVDCRTVVDEIHEHDAGTAMYLDDETATINVVTDESTLTVGEEGIEVKDGGIGDDQWAISMGDGLRIDDETMSIDDGHGIKIIDEKVALDLEAAAGKGLVPDGDELKIDRGHGIDFDGEDKVSIVTGDGFGLSGVYPDAELVCSIGHGLKFDDVGVGRVKVDIESICGVGLEPDNGNIQVDLPHIAHDGLKAVGSNLEVNYADGLTISGGRLEILASHGVRNHNPGGEPVGDYLLEKHLKSGGGIQFISDGLAEDMSIFAGDGIYYDDGALKIDTGDTTEIDLNFLVVSTTGEGITPASYLNELELLLKVDGGLSLETPSGEDYEHLVTTLSSHGYYGEGLATTGSGTPAEGITLFSRVSDWVGTKTDLNISYGLKLDSNENLIIDVEEIVSGALTMQGTNDEQSISWNPYDYFHLALDTEVTVSPDPEDPYPNRLVIEGVSDDHLGKPVWWFVAVVSDIFSHDNMERKNASNIAVYKAQALQDPVIPGEPTDAEYLVVEWDSCQFDGYDGKPVDVRVIALVPTDDMLEAIGGVTNG